MKVTLYDQKTQGTYGYTINIDLTYFYTKAITGIQPGDDGTFGDVVSSETAINTLLNYINDVDCPDIAYSVNSDILTIFLKTSVYSYAATTDLLIMADRYALPISSLSDVIDVSDSDIPLLKAYAIREACQLTGEREPLWVRELIKKAEG